MQQVQAIGMAIQAGVPVLLWGPPGVGKSATIRALGQSLGWPVEVVIASIREPSDFSGLPIPDGDIVRMAPPAWARRLANAEHGILFLDEISTAPPAVQAALLRVVLDRVVGDLALPNSIAVVAAANPPEQTSSGWDLSAPLANRFCHLSWELDANSWTDGMLAGWPIPTVKMLPHDWEQRIAKHRALVAAFIRARPHLLHHMPEKESDYGHAWPSPRTWDMAARLLGACESISADADTEASLLSGCVGEPAALEFLAWRKALDLSDPEQLLAHPESLVVPKRGDQQYAVLAAVVAAATREPLNQKRIAAAWQIVDRVRTAGMADVAAVAARPLAKASLRIGYTAIEAIPFLDLFRAAESR